MLERDGGAGHHEVDALQQRGLLGAEHDLGAEVADSLGRLGERLRAAGVGHADLRPLAHQEAGGLEASAVAAEAQHEGVAVLQRACLEARLRPRRVVGDHRVEPGTRGAPARSRRASARSRTAWRSASSGSGSSGTRRSVRRTW